MGHSNDDLGDDEIEFIRERDSFYIASEARTGGPICNIGAVPGDF